MKKFPSAKEIVEEALTVNPRADINQLHTLTYDVMLKHRNSYYSSKADKFLDRPFFKKLGGSLHAGIKGELLKPIIGGQIEYSNMMEEASRRISQTFQVISGNIAEVCVERELNRKGLKKGIHFLRKTNHTDFTFFHPLVKNPKSSHRVEVKNVAVRERATRGLAFDGDSLLGFFTDAGEFTDEIISIIDKHCKKTGGYCYIPPTLIKQLGTKLKGKKFKSNLEVSSDMLKFVDNGTI